MKKLSPLSFTAIVAVLWSALLPLSLRAAVQVWDPDGATPGTGVSGNWDTITPNWTATADSGVNSTWTQGNDAIFLVTNSYTATLTEPITLVNLTLSGTNGTLTLSGTSANSLNLASSAIFDTGGRGLTISAPINGASSLTRIGGGTMTLSGANTYSGGASLNAGTVAIAVDTIAPGGVITSGPFGTGTVTTDVAASTMTASGAARVLQNPITLNANLTIGGSSALTFTNGNFSVTGAGRTLTVNNSADTTIRSSLTDDGTARTLTKAGSGRLIMMTTDSPFLGGITASAGTLVAGNATPFPTNNNNTITLNAGTLDLNGFNVRISRLGGNVNGKVLLGANTLTAGCPASSEFSGVISGTGGYVKVGSTSQVLSGTNTFNGGITINESVIYFPTNIVTGSPYALGPGTNTITINGTGRIGANRNSPSISIVTNKVILASGASAGLDPANGGHFILSGQASGPGGFLRYSQGGGYPILAGDNTFTGGVQMDARVVGLGHKNALGTGTLTIGNPTNLPTQPLELATIVDLIGANAITNPVAVNQDFALNTTRTNWNSELTFGLELSGPMTLAAGIKTIAALGTNLLKFSGVISGSGGINLIGTNALILTGANSYEDATTVGGGKLLVNNTTGSGTGTNIVTVLADGTLGGTGTVGGPVTVVSGGTIGAGSSAGKLTMTNGLDLSSGGTNAWELAAPKDNNTGIAGTDFDQLALTGGNLALGAASTLSLQFIGSATVPSFGNAFWQSNHTWKIISLSGTAANPGSSNFGTIAGTNGINAGTFSTSVDGGGNIILSFVAAPFPARPVIDSNIVSAGTTSATISWSAVDGVTYQVQYKDDLSAPTWSVLGTVTASGSTASITDTTNPPATQRFYRVVIL